MFTLYNFCTTWHNNGQRINPLRLKAKTLVLLKIQQYYQCICEPNVLQLGNIVSQNWLLPACLVQLKGWRQLAHKQLDYQLANKKGARLLPKKYNKTIAKCRSCNHMPRDFAVFWSSAPLRSACPDATWSQQQSSMQLTVIVWILSWCKCTFKYHKKKSNYGIWNLLDGSSISSFHSIFFYEWNKQADNFHFIHFCHEVAKYKHIKCVWRDSMHFNSRTKMTLSSFILGKYCKYRTITDISMIAYC